MTKEMQRKMLERRIALLEGRNKDNHGVVAKLKRKVKALED